MGTVRPRRPIGRDGFSLLEALVALAILGVILVVAYAAISQGLRVQSGQEAATSTQARLRRVTEVVTQELRGAVLGSVANTPYESGRTSVSFLLLDGGAGYQVTSIDAASNRLNVVGDSGAFGGPGTQLMLVDAGGQAVIFTLQSNNVGSGGTRQLAPNAASCFLGLTATAVTANQNSLLFRVKTLGLEYDGEDTLFVSERNETPLPLAFNLSGVRFDYIYQGKDTGQLHSLPAPLTVAGQPVKQGTLAGEAVELIRLQLELRSTAQSLSGEVERNYVSQVDLGTSHSFNIKAVRSCG